ncbi:MAG: UTP--glucose-1-phosphate uridylyltransferase [Candidatus Thiodiazotropha sp. (ex Semelilucina semeliformis)]|nr:UTP--glucose-1-phosphate uridylyltransferase [Candidatus Thiodiazotropha sp. (ex Semelilucina semeliformis)]MCU7830394.1 UTP--glucose-1-phosphate uridylyltransferase [Candidatus Thiodiazotropha sp. (ex Myrtea sp. 'scaly one' KF741663)]
MRETPPPERQLDRTLALGLLIILLLSTPVMIWWTSYDSPWYVPYLLWLAIILFIAWIHSRHHDP